MDFFLPAFIIKKNYVVTYVLTSTLLGSLGIINVSFKYLLSAEFITVFRRRRPE